MTTGQPGSVGTTRLATLSATGTGSPGLASALAAGTWKVAGGTDAQQKALLSQVSAALQSGQPVSLAVRAGPNVGSNPARILTAGTVFSSVVTTTTTTLATAASATASAAPNPTTTSSASIAKDSDSTTDNS